MKRSLSAGFLGLISSLWCFAIFRYVQENLVARWSSNRFCTSVSELGLTLPLLIALFFLALSIVVLCVELFRKD